MIPTKARAPVAPPATPAATPTMLPVSVVGPLLGNATLTLGDVIIAEGITEGTAVEREREERAFLNHEDRCKTAQLGLGDQYNSKWALNRDGLTANHPTNSNACVTKRVVRISDSPSFWCTQLHMMTIEGIQENTTVLSDTTYNC